jgi:dihydroneopterin aldolase
MDIVTINGLRVSTVIGVLPWERQVKQTLVLDVELATDAARAALSDDVADAVDYQRVTERIHQLSRELDCGLIETLAERITASLIDEFAVPWVRLRVTKRALLDGVKDVSLVIERGSRA